MTGLFSAADCRLSMKGTGFGTFFRFGAARGRIRPRHLLMDDWLAFTWKWSFFLGVNLYRKFQWYHGLVLFVLHKWLLFTPAARFRLCLSLPPNKEIRMQHFLGYGLSGDSTMLHSYRASSVQRFPGAGRWLDSHISTHLFDDLSFPRLHFLAICEIACWLFTEFAQTEREITFWEDLRVSG